MAIDAMEAGKDVYCEKPMTRTIAEADRRRRYGEEERTASMTVGVQSMADPTWRLAHEYIRAGKIGKVLQGQTSYFRNSDVGQWRYYPLDQGHEPEDGRLEDVPRHKFDVGGEKLGPTPKDMPFDRAVFAQWRCYWPFGGGMFTDLFVHQTTHLIPAMGVRFPGASSAPAASTWSTTAATCRTWRRWSPTTTRAARSSSRRRCATTCSSAR